MTSTGQKKVTKKELLPCLALPAQELTLNPTSTNISTADTTATIDDQNPNPNPRSDEFEPTSPPSSPPPIAPWPQDLSLATSSHLTRPELLRRRSHHLKQLSRCYRDYHWALLEELRVQFRQYYWKYGISPFAAAEGNSRKGPGEDDGFGGGVEGSGETTNYHNVSGSGGGANNNVNGRVWFGAAGGEGNQQCVFVGCKLKAMALTRFCHLHILSDSRQKLYKACTYVIKSAQAGPITCAKPILRSTVPSLCAAHSQMAHKHMTRALKKVGLNVSSSSKLAPKLHVIIAEFVCQIQGNRRISKKAAASNVSVKLENAS